TGKSTLAKALAQKMAIRFSRNFVATHAAHINGATLASRGLSSAAIQVSEVFRSVADNAQWCANVLSVVIIDDVDNIVSSTSGDPGSVRLSSAFTAGFESISAFSNVFVLCTASSPRSLDRAFVDRCGLVFELKPADRPACYQILRGQILTLTESKTIESEEDIP